MLIGVLVQTYYFSTQGCDTGGPTTFLFLDAFSRLAFISKNDIVAECLMVSKKLLVDRD